MPTSDITNPMVTITITSVVLVPPTISPRVLMSNFKTPVRIKINAVTSHIKPMIRIVRTNKSI